MKINLLPLCLLTLLPTSVFALEGVADEAPPPSPIRPPLGKIANEKPTETVAYLGIGTRQIPELLATHLPIDAGTGVVVRDVDASGPAALAGIETNDVILSINDESVSRPADVSRLIRQLQAEDTISVRRIHRGKQDRVQVKLSARELPALGRRDLRQNPGTDSPYDEMLNGMPPDQAQRIRDLLERNLQALQGPVGDGMNQIPELENMMREAQQQMRKTLESPMNDQPEPNQGRIQLRSEATVRVMDNQGSVELRTIDGGKEAVVRDPQNNIIWSGPWNSPEDRSAAPEEVRQRLDQLNFDPDFKGKGLRFKFNGHGWQDR